MADTTTTTPTKTSQEMIDEQYASALKAQQESLKKDYDTSRMDYEAKLGQSDETYQPLRNEAYVNNALAEKTRRENMANMGLSGGGGTSLSLQQRNTGNLLSTLGDVSRAQQGYEDEIGLTLAKLDTTYAGSESSAAAENESQRLAAQLAQGQFDQNYALSEATLAETKRSNTFDQYYQLYKTGRITKGEFELATGIDLK